MAEPGRSRPGSTLPSLFLALLLLLSTLPLGCGGGGSGPPGDPFLVVLGIAQDGGVPQIACREERCRQARLDPRRARRVACLGLVDPVSGDRFLIDAPPDLPAQVAALDEIAPPAAGHGLAGILLTHAHIGHYLGLAQLGREALGAWEIPVWAMPRMQSFLTSNGPWDQLVRLHNVVLRPLAAGRTVDLTPRLQITPLPVPHRDEYSETVGFRIRGPKRTALYIPDIDKWERWDVPLEEALREVDVAWLDGTFYADGELPDRDMSTILHPFIVETMARLAPLPASEREKVRFIHLNHTNPALDPDGEAARAIQDAGFRVAVVGERVDL